MKVIKWIVFTTLAIIVVIAACGWGYLNFLEPDYSDQFELPGLKGEVELFYDEFGIPHIYTEHDEDAFRVLGYVQAKDRLWQMELVRRIAPGRLSEIFGEATVKTDQLFRTLGLQQYSEASVAHFNNEMDPEIRENALAYLAGINQFIDTGTTPIEFQILGIDKSHFAPVDLYNVLGYMSFSFAMAHKTDPILSHILDKYGEEYLADLNVHVDSTTALIRSGVGQKSIEALSIEVNDIMNELPSPAFIGSNSWVLSGTKTKSGKPILANDPHIGFSQPAVWYEAHLKSPNFETYGYFLAGCAYPQLCHDEFHAIGLTMFENDDIDFFREKENPENNNQYLYNGEWLPFQIRKEMIQVKDAEPVELLIKETVHGPLVNGAFELLENEDPISLWWTYTQLPNHGYEALHHLMNAKNMAEAKHGTSFIHAPGLNVMYADTEGNIAWWASAALPKRPGHVNSKLILKGDTDEDEAKTYFDFSENPHAENPSWGYVYSANNQPVVEGQPLYPGYYLPEDRARRIEQLLESKNDWTAEEVMNLQLDVTSENVREIKAVLLSVLDSHKFDGLEKKVYQILQSWPGSFGVKETGPIVYNKWCYHIIHDLFADELGNELFKVFNGTHVMKRSLQPIFSNANAVWWDNVESTASIETRDEILTNAFRKSVEELSHQFGSDMSTWEWGSVHTLEHNHSFAVVPSLKKYFNVGPFPVPGNIETINNLMHQLQPDGTYEVLAGPSTRRVVDFSDVAHNSWGILPTGQSGNVMSEHYDDQAELYVRGEFRRQLMDRKEIEEKALHRVVIRPSN